MLRAPHPSGSSASTQPQSKGELEAAVVRLNQKYHKGRQVLEVKRVSDIRCNVCDKRFLRVSDAASHCTQRSHHSLLAESLENEARELRRKVKQLKSSEKAHQTKRVGGALPAPLLIISEEAYTVHLHTTLPTTTLRSTSRRSSTATQLLLWAPEVMRPKSNVHYLHARANTESLLTSSEAARSESTSDSDSLPTSFPIISAFRLIPVRFAGSPKPPSDPPKITSAHPQVPPSHQWCIMQHASSGLFVSASLAQRGLMWLHENIDEAVLVRLIPEAPDQRLPRYHIIVRGQPREAGQAKVVSLEWVASVYAPERKETNDLGTFTEDRRSIVLTMFGNGAIHGPKGLYCFQVLVVSAPTNATTLATKKNTAKKGPKSAYRRRLEESSGDDSEDISNMTSDSSSDSGNDQATSNSNGEQSEEGAEDDDDSDDEAPPVAASSPAADDDGDASSADEDFLYVSTALRDSFSVFTRRQQTGSFFQDRCVCKRKSGTLPLYCCGALGAERFTVIGFGEKDALVRYYRTTSSSYSNGRPRVTEDADKANCMLCVLTAGIPGQVSACRIPVLVTTRAVKAGEAFLCLASSLLKFHGGSNTPTSAGAASSTNVRQSDNTLIMQKHHPALGAADAPVPHFCDTEWYINTFQPEEPAPEAAVPLSSVLPKPTDTSFVIAEAQPTLYYYGNHPSLALPHRDAVLQFPFNLIEVRPCMRLRGELEVVAKHFVPMGTCFLYCGPRIRRRDESDRGAISTAMSIDRRGRRIKGGNIMRFVNHRFGFAAEGNVAFRRGAIMYRGVHHPERGPMETHINFFIATKDIPAGELLLAEGYGPEYDSFIERIAYCGGRYLSAEERLLLTEHEGSEPQHSGAGGPSASSNSSSIGSYAACYLTDIHVGSVVGRRDGTIRSEGTSATPSSGKLALQSSDVASAPISFFRVTAITDDNVLLGEKLEDAFPYLFDRLPDGTGQSVPRVAILRKTEAILFIPGWDYEDTVPPADVHIAAAHGTKKRGGDAVDEDSPASVAVGDADGAGAISWCVKLKMPKEALGRATYADLAGGGPPPSQPTL